MQTDFRAVYDGSIFSLEEGGRGIVNSGCASEETLRCESLASMRGVHGLAGFGSVNMFGVQQTTSEMLTLEQVAWGTSPVPPPKKYQRYIHPSFVPPEPPEKKKSILEPYPPSQVPRLTGTTFQDLVKLVLLRWRDS